MRNLPHLQIQMFSPYHYLPTLFARHEDISASVSHNTFPAKKYIHPAQFNFSSFFLLTASSTAISFASGYAFWNSPASSQHHENYCQSLLLSLSLSLYRHPQLQLTRGRTQIKMMHRICTNNIFHGTHSREGLFSGFVERGRGHDPDVTVGQFDGGGTASYGHYAEAGEWAAGGRDEWDV